MDFEFSARTQDIQDHLREFIDHHVAPKDAEFRRRANAGDYPLDILEPMKARAYAAGLWNLFLPGLTEDEPGTRLTNLEFAPLAEIMGRLPWCPEVFNCSAPDTGNMELLLRLED